MAGYHFGCQKKNASVKMPQSYRTVSLGFMPVSKNGLWNLTVKNGEHNHPPIIDIAGHAAARRLNQKEKILVEHNIKAGVSPRET